MTEVSITKRQVLAYTLLPGIFPRVREFGQEGFSYLAYFIALVYRAVRLLPDTHPFLNSANIGRYGIRHVIGEAANHLVLKKENIDQIIIFFALLFGLLILVLQLGTALVAIVIPQALAATMPTTFDGFFGNTAPAQDLAFILLDRVFGVPDIFGSCVSTATPCYGTAPDGSFGDPIPTPATFPWPFHDALHVMFQFYSIALLIVAVMIFLYFIVAITAETAQTGTPFGKRFNTVWAPIRMVVALGLLIPLTHGLNSAQYITLYAAKYGSNMATNGWLLFNEEMNAAGQQGLIANDEMVVRPEVQELTDIAEFMMYVHTCVCLEEMYLQTAEVVRDGGWQYGVPGDGNEPSCYAPTANANSKYIAAYLVRNPSLTGGSQRIPLVDAEYQDALDFFNNGTIKIRFGERPRGTAGVYSGELGRVFPYCGDLVLPVTDIHEPGSRIIREKYYNIVRSLWDGGTHGSVCNSQVSGVAHQIIADSFEWARTTVNSALHYQYDKPTADLKTRIRDALREELDCTLNEAVQEQVNNGFFGMPAQLRERGWVAAAIWYNRVARMNGALISAAYGKPRPEAYPFIMESVKKEKLQQDEELTAIDQFNPKVAGKSMVMLTRADGELQAANSLYDLVKFWREDGLTDDTHVEPTGNAIIDMINFIFGTSGLFSIRDNETMHPLAQLVGVGKSLIESTIRNVGFGSLAGVGSILLPGQMGELAGVASSFFLSIAGIGLTAGFILFYVIPFLPFIYFFFAAGKWVRTIFEAMVGVPLWALAHLRIDGNGLPGDAAMNGYYLIFEIFIRPILVLFGLFAGMATFAAMAYVLHDIFDLVVENLTGHDSQDTATLTEMARGPIDELFFTVIYTIILYMMALSSFKLVDLIPNSILRWMGASVPTFGDQAPDAAEGMSRYVAIGGSMTFGQITEGMSGAFQGGANIRKGIEQEAAAAKAASESGKNAG